MARKLQIEYPGAIYHVMNRGDRREAIFLADKDRELFVATLAEACAKADWQVHAYCLMGNHFHLVVETPKGNLVAGMKWFLKRHSGLDIGIFRAQGTHPAWSASRESSIRRDLPRDESRREPIWTSSFH